MDKFLLPSFSYLLPPSFLSYLLTSFPYFFHASNNPVVGSAVKSSPISIAALKGLERLELLLAGRLCHLENVVANGLRERPALADGDDVANFDVPEGRAEVHRHIAMPLLVTLVLANVVKVVSSNNDGALHLHLYDNSCENATTNKNIAGEWTLLIDVVSIDSFTRRLEAKTNVLDISDVFLGAGQHTLLVIQEDGRLLLKSPFSLDIGHCVSHN